MGGVGIIDVFYFISSILSYSINCIIFEKSAHFHLGDILALQTFIDSMDTFIFIIHRKEILQLAMLQDFIAQ